MKNIFKFMTALTITAAVAFSFSGCSYSVSERDPKASTEQEKQGENLSFNDAKAQKTAEKFVSSVLCADIADANKSTVSGEYFDYKYKNLKELKASLDFTEITDTLKGADKEDKKEISKELAHLTGAYLDAYTGEFKVNGITKNLSDGEKCEFTFDITGLSLDLTLDDLLKPYNPDENDDDPSDEFEDYIEDSKEDIAKEIKKLKQVKYTLKVTVQKTDKYRIVTEGTSDGLAFANDYLDYLYKNK